jgi:hypothetical protein
MIATLRARPFKHPAERFRRLGWSGGLLLALIALALWNPVQRSGPILCPSRLLVGVPCPLCGATRGVALCLRGQAVAAAGLNPLAPPITLGLLVLFLKWAGESLIDRRLVLVWSPAGSRLRLALTALVLVLVWVWVLLYRWEDSFADSWLGRWLGCLRALCALQ